MRTTTKRRGTATVLAALALGITGCGVSAGGGSPVEVQAGSFSGPAGVERLGEAVRSTVEVSTLQVAGSASVSGLDGVGDADVTFEGAIDLTVPRATVTAEVGGEGLAAGLGTIDAVLDGGDAYVRSATLGFLVGAGDGWVKVDADELAGGRLSEELGPQQFDPTVLLDLLEQVGGPVEEVGTEDVRGVATTHVRAEIAPDRVLAQLPEAYRSEVDDLLARYGLDPAGLPAVPVEAWIGDDGLVRKVSVSVDLGAGSATADLGLGDAVVSATVELHGFGDPIDVAVPPASEVTDLDLGSLLSRFGYDD